jgi:phosphate transport system protein
MSLFKKELESLKQELSLMAREAETMLEMAIHVLETRSESVAEQVFTTDHHLDSLEISIDQKCITLLALTDPYANDFRFIFSIIKTNKDLERVGDEAKSIVKWSRKLKGLPEADIMTLAEKSKEALNTAVKALINLDPVLARKTLDLEFQVDAIEDQILERSTSIPTAFIAKSLERIADMATNIAENVIFSVKAEDIRHGQGNNPDKHS